MNTVFLDKYKTYIIEQCCKNCQLIDGHFDVNKMDLDGCTACLIFPYPARKEALENLGLKVYTDTRWVKNRALFMNAEDIEQFLDDSVKKMQNTGQIKSVMWV